MNALQSSLSTMYEQIASAIPGVIAALLLLVLAWIVALIVRFIVQKGLRKLGVDRLMAKSRVSTDTEQSQQILTSIGRVVYYLVFILFLPGILDALGLTSVSQPISGMMNTLLAYLPNLLAAAFILVIGVLIARLVRDLVFHLLQSMNIDRWFDRLNRQAATTEQQETLAKILANVLYVVLLIPIITVALETLNITTISEPIVSMLNSILAMIPNIFVALILLLAGVYIGKFVAELLTSLLQRTGINNVYRYVDPDNRSSQASRLDVATVVGQATKILIIIFFTVEALNVLQLDVLNQVGTAILGYLPLAVSGVLILGLGLIAGNLLANAVRRYTGSRFSAALLRYIIITVAVFMTLDQLEFASTIVNIAFLLILGALAVAFAISFGIGGREFAKRQLAKFETKMEKEMDHTRSATDRSSQDDTHNSDSDDDRREP